MHDALRLAVFDLDGTLTRPGTSVLHTLGVGDARSDVPAIAAAGYSVGFNATAEVEALASTSVRSTDLCDVLPPIRRLLPRS